MIVLAIMTSIAYSHKDFEAACRGPMQKRLLFAVLGQNFKDQLRDIQQYDVFQGLPFVRSSQRKAVNYANIDISTITPESQDSSHERDAAVKLYTDRIEIIPESMSIRNSLLVEHDQNLSSSLLKGNY